MVYMHSAYALCPQQQAMHLPSHGRVVHFACSIAWAIVPSLGQFGQVPALLPWLCAWARRFDVRVGGIPCSPSIVLRLHALGWLCGHKFVLRRRLPFAAVSHVHLSLRFRLSGSCHQLCVHTSTRTPRRSLKREARAPSEHDVRPWCVRDMIRCGVRRSRGVAE